MKIKTITYPISFEKLIRFFTITSDKVFSINSRFGKGTVQTFNLERGLQARVWDCTFNKEIKIYNQKESENDTYYTIVYFLDTKGLSFAKGQEPYQESYFCDNLLFSSESDFKMHVAPNTKGLCLSISFSKKWLCAALEGNKVLEPIKEKICTASMLYFSTTMNVSERNMIKELIKISCEKYFGTFFIKAAVLKIVSDFFYKLKELDNFPIALPFSDSVICEVEQYLNNHIKGKLPVLKLLAQKFSISESTLKKAVQKETWGQYI